MSYGASDSDAYRRAGSHYVPRILKGAKPGDLPVEMPSKYELVISVVAAKALGLDIPPKLLSIADPIRTLARSGANSGYLDSERFRSAPRTFRCFRGSLSLR
jgi:ABC transporter substrate binding protein